jgi:hypothetical protein
VTFRAVLEEWPLVEAAIHEKWGVDLSAPGVLRSTSWRWFWTRVTYLLTSQDNALGRHFAPREEPDEETVNFDL